MEVLLQADAQVKRLDQTLIKLFVDSVNKDNSNVKFLSVNETMITASRYKSGK